MQLFFLLGHRDLLTALAVDRNCVLVPRDCTDKPE